MLGQPMRIPSINTGAVVLRVRLGFDCVFFFTAGQDYQNGNAPCAKSSQEWRILFVAKGQQKVPVQNGKARRNIQLSSCANLDLSG